ncbi:stress protein [Paenisporosarcina sp. NPDC076898]|uniref:stress protein n=1 Tax=unclassified Paenisporosarcina TaxID=2642018 RepID=UPI003D074266
MKRIVMLIGMAILLAVMSACGNGGGSSATTADVVQQFKDDGLELGETSDLPKKEFGNMRKEGTRILIPSIGDDAGGRIFLFDNEKDLAKAKAYYDDLGDAGSMFYSHTHQAGNFLLQMSGDMSDEDFQKYADSLDKVK